MHQAYNTLVLKIFTYIRRRRCNLGTYYQPCARVKQWLSFKFSDAKIFQTFLFLWGKAVSYHIRFLHLIAISAGKYLQLNKLNWVALVTKDEERWLSPTGNKWNMLPSRKNQFSKITAVGQKGDLRASLGTLWGETVQVMAVLWRFVLRFIFITNPVHKREEVKWN